MCQAVVYLAEDRQDREILRDVTLLEPIAGGVRLSTFFDEPVTVPARIGRIDFLKHTVTLLPLDERPNGQD
jgi:predicted RNA-binding protein